MRFKVTKENVPPKKNKKAKKAKQSKKFSFKETVFHGSDYISNKAKKTKEKVKQLRSVTFASTKLMWKPYAMMIADYFNWEYYRNFDYIFDKLKKFNNKKTLTKKDLAQLEVFISLNELKYYINDKDHPKTIDINLDLIDRDFFISKHEEKYYDELIEESDSKYHYSISYLLKVYNLLITFVKEKECRLAFYDAVVNNERKEEKEENHPVVINEKIIKILPVHDYLSNKYKKKAEYTYGN